MKVLLRRGWRPNCGDVVWVSGFCITHVQIRQKSVWVNSARAQMLSTTLYPLTQWVKSCFSTFDMGLKPGFWASLFRHLLFSRRTAPAGPIYFDGGGLQKLALHAWLILFRCFSAGGTGGAGHTVDKCVCVCVCVCVCECVCVFVSTGDTCGVTCFAGTFFFQP